MIQRVDRLHAELQLGSFCDLGVLDQRQLFGPCARIPEKREDKARMLDASCFAEFRSKPAYTLNQRLTLLLSFASGMFFRSPVKMEFPNPNAAQLW